MSKWMTQRRKETGNDKKQKREQKEVMRKDNERKRSLMYTVQYVTCIFLYLKDRVSNDDIIHAVLVVHGGVHRDLQPVEDERGQPKH